MVKRKESKLLFFSQISKFFILFISFLVILSFADKSKVAQKLVPAKNYYQKPKTIQVDQIIKIPTPIPPPFVWTVEKQDEHITKMSLPPDVSMSTPDELFNAMNVYRQDHGISTIQKSDSLCSIAQKRADEQVANGGLDNHAGFDKFAQNQQEFSRMGEVLFGGVQPQYGVHIVEFGWDRSLTGHREAIQDTSWQYGCGGIAGYYAVFIFGAH